MSACRAKPEKSSGTGMRRIFSGGAGCRRFAGDLVFWFDVFRIILSYYLFLTLNLPVTARFGNWATVPNTDK